MGETPGRSVRKIGALCDYNDRKEGLPLEQRRGRRSWRREDPWRSHLEVEEDHPLMCAVDDSRGADPWSEWTEVYSRHSHLLPYLLRGRGRDSTHTHTSMEEREGRLLPSPSTSPPPSPLLYPFAFPGSLFNSIDGGEGIGEAASSFASHSSYLCLNQSEEETCKKKVDERCSRSMNDVRNKRRWRVESHSQR